jgi:hypothetical protein
MMRTTCAKLLAVASTAAVVARHLALLAFAGTVALAAWPPAETFTGSAAGRHFSVRMEGRRMVAEVSGRPAGADGMRVAPPSARAVPPVARHLPAGIVVGHAGSMAGPVRLTVPMAAEVAAVGLLWLATLWPGGMRRAAPDSVGAPVQTKDDASAPAVPAVLRIRPVRLGRTRSWLWRFRYAMGSLLVAAAWLAVYTLPRDAVGVPFTEMQALHVAFAAFAVCGATMLITFD